MNYMLCPACGDKVVNGKCTFCGYELNEDEKRNARYGSDNSGATFNQSKNASNQSINDCKDHMAHNINREVNNFAESVHDFTSGQSNYSGSSTDRNYETLRIVAIITLFFSQLVSAVICIIALNSCKDEVLREKFKKILIIDIVIFALGIFFSVFASILPLILGSIM